MPLNVPAPSLELDQDLGADRREWRFERIGWLFLLLLILGGMAGLLGDGPVSATEQRSAGGAAIVRYHRIARVGSTDVLSIQLPRAGAGDSLVVIAIGRSLLDGADIERVTPSPVAEQGSATEVRFVMRRVAGHPVQVDFVLAPSSPGRRCGTVATPGGDFEIRQLTLP